MVIVAIDESQVLLITIFQLRLDLRNMIEVAAKYFNNLPLFSTTGGRTPSYGYMTPSHDPSQTPQHGGSAWDPSVANTPAR